jgi:hypothetical protein
LNSRQLHTVYTSDKLHIYTLNFRQVIQGYTLYCRQITHLYLELQTDYTGYTDNLHIYTLNVRRIIQGIPRASDRLYRVHLGLGAGYAGVRSHADEGDGGSRGSRARRRLLAEPLRELRYELPGNIHGVLTLQLTRCYPRLCLRGLVNALSRQQSRFTIQTYLDSHVKTAYWINVKLFI